MLKPAGRRRLQSIAKSLTDPGFWSLFLVFCLAAFVIGVATMLAVERYDTYLRLRPLVCLDGVSDRQFLIVAMVAPLWLLFTLISVAELWQQVEHRRKGQPTHWFHFGWFFTLASVLGLLVLLGLRC